jgi:hypothetical protein
VALWHSDDAGDAAFGGGLTLQVPEILSRVRNKSEDSEDLPDSVDVVMCVISNPPRRGRFATPDCSAPRLAISVPGDHQRPKQALLVPLQWQPNASPFWVILGFACLSFHAGVHSIGASPEWTAPWLSSAR